MRKDMNKVLVTTPRIGSWMKNYEVKNQRRSFRDGDHDLPSHSSMKPKTNRTSCERKSLNEYLNPLSRYLNKNIGRVWDDIYSDICKNMDKRTPVQAHIFQHLFDYVELHPIFKDGKPHQINWGGLMPMYNTGWSFYVDKKGFLRRPKEMRPPWNNKKDDPNLISTKDENLFYIKRKSDGVWFRATLEKPPSYDLSPSLSYLIRERNPTWAEDIIGSYRTSGKKIVLKTLSKKEKKKLNLYS